MPTARGAVSRAQRELGLLRQRGHTVNCPCCRGWWKAMESFRGREAARCPGCGALERHRILWLFLTREAVLRRPVSLLHFAPEDAIARPLSRIPGVDYLSGDLRPGAAMEVVDITSIRYDDASFDVVLCNHVLEHIPDDRLAMSELRRILKPGGLAVLQHPIDEARAETYEDPAITAPEDRRRAFGQHDHVRWYGRDFPDRLASVGFDVLRRRYVDECDATTRTQCALRDGWDGVHGADIFLARRRAECGEGHRSPAAH